MKPIALTIASLFLVVACSNNQGELVEKSPADAASSTPAQVASQSEMPAGHPPIGGAGMSDLMGGGKTALSPGPAREPIAISGSTAKVASLEFQIDPAWVSVQPQSSMRAAQFRLPAPEGAQGDGEMAVFQGIGGSADANIQRWIGQLSDRIGEPKIEKLQIGPFSIQKLDVSGSLSISAMMGGAGTTQSGYRMLAAVVEGPGNGPWQFKLTGPEKTLEKWKPAFDAMIDSLKPAN